MEAFEHKLTSFTRPENRQILGAIGLVVDQTGKIVYRYANGFQSLDADAAHIDPNSIFAVGSAGKFITHIAALQCVERGLITLDEPVSKYLPELGNIQVLTQEGASAFPQNFTLAAAREQITLRHLLSHSSGIDYESNPRVRAWRELKGQEPKKDCHPRMQQFEAEEYSTPLMFEPGEGWIYGASVEWTTALICRLTEQSMPSIVQEHIFTPLGMTSSTYTPEDCPDIQRRMLQMVQRVGTELRPAKYPLRELVCSIPDLALLFADLTSPSPKLLQPETMKLVFKPQFAPSSAALAALRNDTENYAFPVGIPSGMEKPPVNHSLAALVIEKDELDSHMPAGTLTWNGMPNFIWALNRERGVGMVFATQLLPVDDERTVDLAMEFMRCAWSTFS